MTTVYRSILETSPESPTDDALAIFSDWLEGKHERWSQDLRGGLPPEISLPGKDQSIVHGHFEIRRTDVANDEVTATRVTLIQEDTPGERWSTELTAWGDGTDSWVWVDVARTADDPYAARVSYSIPGVVRLVLERLECASGPCRLRTEPWLADTSDAGADLAAMVQSKERFVPVLVVTMNGADDGGEARRFADELQRRLTGAALIAVLAPAAQMAFESRIGVDLRVFGGALRTYLPNASPVHAYRHRYVPYSRLSALDRRGWDRLARPLVQQATTVRPPKSFRDHVHRLFKAGGANLGGDQLLEDVIIAEEERDAWKSRHDTLAADSRATLDERDVLLRENEKLRKRLDYLGSLPVEEIAEGDPDSDEEVPKTFGELFDVFDEEDLVVVSNDAWEKAFDLDDFSLRAEWAERTWATLNDLKAYALAKRSSGADRFDGGYWQWLDRGNPSGIDFVPTEGSQTKKDKKLERVRTFEVPRKLDGSGKTVETGKVVMWAHVRIGGGDDPAPRMHLHDDTGGDTGRVYVGYIGEHLDTAGTRRR